jgi:hypothetical protein
MPRKAKADPPNPLPCGCGAMGRPTINWDGTRMEYLGTHVVHCPLHAAAPGLLAALRPFAALDIAHLKTMPDQSPIYQMQEMVITVGDLRRARAALDAAEDAAP